MASRFRRRTCAGRRRRETVICGDAADLLGAVLAQALGWQDVTVARLMGGEDELLGVLCLAGRGRELDAPARNLLQALCGHASVALENARLFSRIAQSNRQWAEIFQRDGGVPAKRLRSEEHTSELQSLTNLVCRLLLEKKKIS